MTTATNTKQRFSKESLLKILCEQKAEIQKQNQHQFKEWDGYWQVIGKGEEINRAYGAFSAIDDLIELIEEW